MKALGLKPVTLWLPDVNSPEFKAQIARRYRGHQCQRRRARWSLKS